MSLAKIIIVGGHGKIALHLAGLLTQTKRHSVASVIRSQDHVKDLQAVSPDIRPLLISLEDAPVSDFTHAFTGSDVVVFSAGAGGKGGPERTRKVDYEGALKIFDAIDALPEPRPRLILVSAIDVRNPDAIPSHYV